MGVSSIAVFYLGAPSSGDSLVKCKRAAGVLASGPLMDSGTLLRIGRAGYNAAARTSGFAACQTGGRLALVDCRNPLLKRGWSSRLLIHQGARKRMRTHPALRATFSQG